MGNIRAEIFTALLDIEQMQQRINQRHAQISTLAKRAYAQLPESERIAIAKDVYWDWEHVSKTEPIAILLGIPSTSGHTAQAMLGHRQITRACLYCGEETKVPITSRTARKAREREYKRCSDQVRRGRISPYLDYQDNLCDWAIYFLCPDCQNQVMEELQEERETRTRTTDLIEKYHSRLDELRTMPYDEYLQTYEWQITRKKALKRAEFSCQICNRTDTALHVHHRTYENIGCERAKDLIVLCADCHKLFHENGRLA